MARAVIACLRMKLTDSVSTSVSAIRAAARALADLHIAAEIARAADTELRAPGSRWQTAMRAEPLLRQLGRPSGVPGRRTKRRTRARSQGAA